MQLYIFFLLIFPADFNGAIQQPQEVDFEWDQFIEKLQTLSELNDHQQSRHDYLGGLRV